MILFEQLRACLFSLLKRNYYLDKWIGDESLLSILHTQYHLLEVSKAYLNQHLQKICLGPTKLFRHMEPHLRHEDRYTRRAYFYFFTLQPTKMTKLSRKDFIQCYFNFRVLRVSNRSNNINTNTCKRKALTDITNNITSPSENRGSSNNENDLHIITPPIVPERFFTTDPVVDYFLSKVAKTLFN